MTSLIWGSIYLAHKGATGAYREKQRRKNYERWEGLRDEYDEQKKITRETRSLDIQRTGSIDPLDDRPIVSLRDLQEANDARTGWRPQESWEPSFNQPTHVQQQPTAQPVTQAIPPPQLYAQGRSGSVPSTYWQGRGEIRPQRTGATWDDGLPAPLRVSRRSFEGDESPHRTSRSNSVQPDLSMQRQGSMQSTHSSSGTPPQFQSPLPDEPVAMNPHFIQQLTGAPAVAQPVPIQSQFMDSLKSPTSTAYPVQPVQVAPPGGRMAELIERGY